jgi:hypothetical protein
MPQAEKGKPRTQAIQAINEASLFGFNIILSPVGDPGVDGRIILRWIFRKWDMGVWAGPSWLRIGNAVMNLRVP